MGMIVKDRITGNIYNAWLIGTPMPSWVTQLLAEDNAIISGPNEKSKPVPFLTDEGFIRFAVFHRGFTGERVIEFGEQGDIVVSHTHYYSDVDVEIVSTNSGMFDARYVIVQRN